MTTLALSISLELHLLMTLELLFTIVICLWYRPLGIVTGFLYWSTGGIPVQVASPGPHHHQGHRGDGPQCHQERQRVQTHQGTGKIAFPALSWVYVSNFVVQFLLGWIISSTWCFINLMFHQLDAWTNFSLQDEPWAEFSTLEVAACIILSTYGPVLQNNLT